MALLPPTGETSALEDDAAAHVYTHSNPSTGSLEVEGYFYIELVKQ